MDGLGFEEGDGAAEGVGGGGFVVVGEEAGDEVGAEAGRADGEVVGGGREGVGADGDVGLALGRDEGDEGGGEGEEAAGVAGVGGNGGF